MKIKKACMMYLHTCLDKYIKLQLTKVTKTVSILTAVTQVQSSYLLY